MLQNSNAIQPKVVVIRRRANQGFGFTLRHFIAYPPEDDPSWPQQEANDPYQVKAMETIFIKEVQPNGPAHFANLQTGDRVLMVNNTPIAGIAYSTIVSMIKMTPSVLTLHVVPKEYDALQMHYTNIAHTPESNRLAAVAISRPIPSPLTVGNGNAAGALVPLSATNKSFPLQHPQQKQMISYHPLPSHAIMDGGAVGTSTTRSSSLTTNSSGLRSLAALPAAGLFPSSSHSDFNEIHHSLQHGAVLMRGDGGLMRSQPQNFSVLTRQQHQQLQNSNSYTNAGDTTDLMIRLRESIKQKEEFLKSPLPLNAQQQQQQQHHSQQQHLQHQQQHQHFFPQQAPNPAHSSASTGSSQLSMASTASSLSGARGQVRTTAKNQQPVSASASASAPSSYSSGTTKDLLPVSCDMHNFYAKHSMPTNYEHMKHRGGAGAGVSRLHEEVVKQPAASQPTHAIYASVAPRNHQRTVTPADANINGISISTTAWEKYPKDLDYLESLSETGVTNQVFERKLVSSHLTKGFDPFKQLSINTNAAAGGGLPEQHTAAAAATASNIMAIKKQPVLYESLQHHPLHQLQLKQQQQPQHIQMTSTPIRSVVDGQQSSRMEIHKANLATTIDYAPTLSKYTINSLQSEDKSMLADISETNDIPLSSKAISTSVNTDGVVRRYRPVSAQQDDNKPMRRISYLRATNNENEYHTETSSPRTTPLTTTTATTASAGETSSSSKASLDEPTYEVVGAERDTPATPLAVGGASSRRSSVNSELRNSIHIESDFCVKMDTKDVSTETDLFETEMEIKSPCINGKRISEYRSWRQVKIEIKGDTLKIYPSRNSKSENNVIELDIKNFNIFDESVDKKKYIFRLQSKPQQQPSGSSMIASVANELSLEDGNDKLASSGSSSSTSATALEAQHTEILFKTKSLTEMKRIYGLLQWKCSLIFCESGSDIQGKQLAEPQKIAATASLPTATTTDCDENVLQSENSPPTSSTRICSAVGSAGGDLELAADSISPVMKTRKSSSHKCIPDKDLGSPKAKNWKDLLFRRGGNHSADISPSSLASNAKTIGSIGVPLRSCVMSKNNEFLPHIVDICTNIVETKGLGVVGIYRIPGNKAAISELSDQVNKPDFSWERCSTDVRWEDVNVVSSLLKLFIRSLPDALLPCSFYINFIEADKKPGLVRLKELKELLESLPRHSYETMKHLIRHLSRVSKNCAVNLMEPKNLAIIFGPSIIRTPNDTLEIAVKDMKHQCRIVELLLTQYEYFFENGSTPDIANVSGNVVSSAPSASSSTSAQSQEDQTNMLLHNVSKIERLTDREQSSSSSSKTSRFIPNLRRRTHSKRSAVSSDTYSGESVLSLDYNTKMNSSCGAISANSSGIAANTSNTSLGAKKGVVGRTHHRKASLDEKDSSISGGSGGSCKDDLQQQRSSVDIALLLTDEESSNSRISDSGSMSLATITDALDSKLRNLRSGSESNDENEASPDFPPANRRHTFGQPLHLHSENIPYADESPERYYHHVPLPLFSSSSCILEGATSSAMNSSVSSSSTTEKEPPQRSLTTSKVKSNHKLQHSATVPISSSLLSPPSSISAAPTSVAVISLKSAKAGVNNSARNLRFSSVYEQCCSEDDSEGSTTSDPKESALIIAGPALFLDRYNKKRRDHRLFRSASFNCRNYSSRGGGSSGGMQNSSSALTKDEKTDMNLTKKRQIQNKQNRSIKRRHTVGGPHDYTSNSAAVNNSSSGCTLHCKHGAVPIPAAAASTTCKNVLRRIPIPSANSNISNNNQQLAERQQINHNNNGNGSVVAGDHVLEVGIRIKNINRSRY